LAGKVVVPTGANVNLYVAESPGKISALAAPVFLFVKSCTRTVTGADVLVRKLVSPEYTAVIWCDPPDRVLIASAALPLSWNPTTPPFVLRATLPRTVVPSRKVTVPVGVGTVDETTAVKVTGLLISDVPLPTLSVIVVGSLPITCERAGETAEL
jgi:hypothetical protein